MGHTYLWGSWSPSQLVATTFLVAIAVGTVLLATPWASVGESLHPLDALFTATSATCVTGLIVVDTGTDLSLFGQLVVLALIQIGGLGIMTFSTLALVLMGKRLRLRDRIVVSSVVYPEGGADLRAVIRTVVGMTLIIETTGALLLAWCWPADSVVEALGAGVFHAVSAFCNAGFSLFSDSLYRLRGDAIVNLTVMALFVLGGLGFPVLLELAHRLRPRRKRRRQVLSLHTKVVLIVSSVLLVVGVTAVYLLEADHALADLSRGDRMLAASFQALTPRTAGFNTLPIASLQAPTLFILMLLMFVGGSPGSTAGGIKTTTVGTMFAYVWARSRGRDSVSLFHRTIPDTDLHAAVTIAAAAIMVLVIGVLGLLLTEGAAPPVGLDDRADGQGFPQQSAPHTALFLELLFEASSALGTVGLSTGITPHLSGAGRMIIIVMMFVGRIGPLTIAVALGQHRRPGAYRYPEEHVLVG